MIQNSVEASRKASFLALLEQVGEHRHERRRQGRVCEQVGHEVGDLEGDRERGRGPARTEEARGDDSRARPTTRDTPVAIEKIAVLRATRSLPPGAP